MRKNNLFVFLLLRLLQNDILPTSTSDSFFTILALYKFVCMYLYICMPKINAVCNAVMCVVLLLEHHNRLKPTKIR